MRKCEVEGCDTKHRAKGLCFRHYQRVWKYGDPDAYNRKVAPEVCELEDCDLPYSRGGFCAKHYIRHYRTGHTGVRLVAGVRNYGSQHKHLANKYGNAPQHKCFVCGDQADEWAFQHTECPESETLYDDVNGSRDVPYSLNDAYYKPMCKQHHRSYDAGISPSWDVPMSA